MGSLFSGVQPLKKENKAKPKKNQPNKTPQPKKPLRNPPKKNQTQTTQNLGAGKWAGLEFKY